MMPEKVRFLVTLPVTERDGRLVPDDPEWREERCAHLIPLAESCATCEEVLKLHARRRDEVYRDRRLPRLSHHACLTCGLRGADVYYLAEAVRYWQGVLTQQACGHPFWSRWLVELQRIAHEVTLTIEAM